MITYDESGIPRIAVAESRLNIPYALKWVENNRDPLMMPDSNGYYLLVHVGSSGSPVIEEPGKIQNVMNTRLAVRKFRDLLNGQC